MLVFVLCGVFLERIKNQNYFIIRVLNNCVEHKLKHLVQKKLDKDDDKVPKKIKNLTAKNLHGSLCSACGLWLT